ncbi:MAG: SRPBCC family protein [Acidimicrobiia bacterium]|nr:SRPBCC family protein [Acidimicrobiia bacterium]
MAIEIRERFSVEAPIDVVWPFIKDPEQLVHCMPGASLDEVVDDRTFLGTVKVKLGAVTAKYKGKVEFAEVDEASHCVKVVAEGREAGGGTARGTLSSRLTALPEGGTEVLAEGDVDLTGRVMQVGRGMIQGVSEQLFQEFARSTKSRLELRDGAVGLDDGAAPVAAARDDEAIRILPLVLRAIRRSLRRAYDRLRARLARRRKGGASGPAGRSAADLDPTASDRTGADRRGSDH